MITLYLARADNGVIGHDGGMPWHIPADLKRFRAMTMGKPMIMGRKTFDGFASPLPGRRHIVLTRDADWRADGAEPVDAPGKALALAGPGDIAVIGGAEVFALYLAQADRVELTEVHQSPEGDAVVPAFDPAVWNETAREEHDGYSFVMLERRAAG